MMRRPLLLFALSLWMRLRLRCCFLSFGNAEWRHFLSYQSLVGFSHLVCAGHIRGTVDCWFREFSRECSWAAGCNAVMGQRGSSRCRLCRIVVVEGAHALPFVFLAWA